MYDEGQAEYEAMMDAKAKAEYEEYCYYEAKKDYLVQLLNEYEISLDSQPYWTRNRVSISEEMIISKKLGFIKWLVDNDKINFELDSIIHQHKGIDYNTGKGIAVQKLCDKYESLLMLLAISDNPIDLLCERLK